MVSKKAFFVYLPLLWNFGLAQHVPHIVENLKLQPPKPVPKYMVDNTNNGYRASPDRGVINGPEVTKDHLVDVGNSTDVPHLQKSEPSVPRLGKGIGKRDGSFWVADAHHGQSPFAKDAAGYKIFRNVKDYGAKGDGSTDDTKAINDAIVDGERCGQKCGSTSTLGAIIYFPPGTYVVSTPIIQYYYTQFVGDANNWPTIKGTKDFKGIALVDTDVYILGGNGAEWYINQNQFYRSIRNFNFDITDMPDKNNVNGQEFVPTCLHWQVAQSTSLQNIHFIMIQGSDKQVGIFMENGSGGFLSDLQFFGGQIGFRAGSQQYTMRGLKFVNTATAISTIWNWGMVWKDIDITNAYVAIDTQSFGGVDGQGTGSLVVQDSVWRHVPYGITLKKGTVSSALVLDNLRTESCENIVMNSGFADPVLGGNAGGVKQIDNWSLGFQVTNSSQTKPTYRYGDTDPKPSKPAVLLGSDGRYFTRSRPQYENVGSGSLVNVLDHGVKNDATGDQTAAINSVLSGNLGSVIYFPAGVYIVQGTVKVPPGSKITGELWPQIMGSGSFFADVNNPKVMIQVGQKGDKGDVEISGMLFTVRGNTAGCIMMEWNIYQGSQGSAGMWDSHFRIGGAAGSDLTLADCPKTAVSNKCKAASMLLHVTSESSGYFENIWAWTADHDLDAPVGDADTTSATQINVFTGRGILIESQGPTWFYGTSSEHHQLYQYQLAGAKNIYLGHLQTETPYYQPSPKANTPYKPSSSFAQDPLFEDCTQGLNSTCTEAWALRVLNSTDVFVYGAGMYSFFSSYEQGCLKTENCQQRLVDIGYSEKVWMFNLFTKGSSEVISPQGGLSPVSSFITQSGFTTELALYFAFALQGKDIGGRSGNDHDTPDNVSILPLPGCTTVAAKDTFTMAASCIPAITSRPSSGPDAAQQNKPPGPEECHEICDIWRLLTGTCCGKGGSMSNPIYIPPNVPVPYDIPLPPGYVPSLNITIPAPGAYNPGEVYGTQIPTTTQPPDGDVTSTSTTYGAGFATGSPGDPHCKKKKCGCIPAGIPVNVLPAGLKLKIPKVIPAGSCFPGDKDGGRDDPPPPKPCPDCPPGGIVLPGPVSLPPSDPPCPHPPCRPCVKGACPDSTSQDGEDGECDPDLSTKTGLCPNGNFPLYDPVSNTINCDVPDDEVPRFLSDCQEEADSDYNNSIDQIECETESCPLPGKRGLASSGGYIMDGNFTSGVELFNLTKRQTAPNPPKKACPVPPPPTGPGAVHPGRPGCDRVFQCDTDIWPNVCNNAASAQIKRAKPTALEYKGPNARQDYVTRQWWRTHAKVGSTVENNPKIVADRDAGALKNQPGGGWGLVGCEVEEYPFGNSIDYVAPNQRGIWSNRAVLRLIPWEENQSHGRALAKFLKDAIQGDLRQGLQGLDPNGGWTYCVDITGNNLDKDDFLLGDDQSKNRCGQAYGPGYLLINDISNAEAKQHPNEPQWDPWFDRNSQLFEHTVYSSGQSIATKMLPSQYGYAPAPGMKTWLPGSNKWTTSVPGGAAVGTEVPANNGPNGKFLKFDTPGVTHQGIKRTIDITDLGYDPRVTDHPPSITAAPATPTTTDNEKESPTSMHTANKIELEEHAVESLNKTVHSKRQNGQLSPRAEQFFKRQSKRGGSFLDVDVYRKAFDCELPYQDPCAVGDCFEGGVFWDADGHVSSDDPGPGNPNGDGTHGGNNPGHGGDGSTTSPSNPRGTPKPLPGPECKVKKDCKVDKNTKCPPYTLFICRKGGDEYGGKSYCGCGVGIYASISWRLHKATFYKDVSYIFKDSKHPDVQFKSVSEKTVGVNTYTFTLENGTNKVVFDTRPNHPTLVYTRGDAEPVHLNSTLSNGGDHCHDCDLYDYDFWDME